MVKGRITIYLEPRIRDNLKKKAEKCGFNGKGYLSNYLNKIASTDILFLDENALNLLNYLQKINLNSS